MSNASRWMSAMVGGLILVGATCAFAQDWPQWRGPNRDGKAAGFTAPAAWPQTLEQKWKVKVGLSDSTPALVGDKLYVFARQDKDEVTLCLDAATGKEIWKDKYEAPAVTGAARGHAGPRSSPAVADGKVVTLGVAGVVSCLNAADGKLAWRKDEFPNVVPKFFAATLPMIVDGMVIVQLGSEAKGAIMALDPATGATKWTWDGEGPMYASPVLMTAGGVKQVVTLTSKSLVGVGLADGKLLWQTPFAPKGMAYNAATPVVDGQTVYFTGSGRGTKAVKVEKKGDAFVAAELWSNPDVAVQFNTPVLKNGQLFGFSDKGFLFCINAQDGKTAWVDKTSYGKGFAGIVDAGSCLMALPSTSQLIVYKPDAKEFSQIAAIKVADTATYATPLVAGNRILVEDQDSLTLWLLK